MRKLNVYKCDFCRMRASESTMIQHEKSCYSNPLVHGCGTCFWMDRFWTANPKCYLMKLPAPFKGHQLTFKRRCKDWISNHQTWNLERYYKEKVSKVV
jgi:hypothetical protein